MFVRQLVRYLEYEYTNGTPKLHYINDALKYYYSKHDKNELTRNKILLSQFKTNKDYSRISLHNDKNFELAMILWRRNAQTEIHRHDSNCSFMVMEGELLETRYIKKDRLILNGTKHYIESELGNVIKDDYHNIFNISLDRSLSIHVYDNNDVFETNLETLML